MGALKLIAPTGPMLVQCDESVIKVLFFPSDRKTMNNFPNRAMNNFSFK